MTETGTTSYIDRMQLTGRINEMLLDFLSEHGFRIIEHGYDLMLRHEPGMKSKLKRLESKESLVGLRVKFAPDFIAMYPKGNRRRLFFIDTKASITPVFFPTHIDRVRKHSKENVTRWDIGEIEREAWFVYNRFFPPDQVAIIDAVPYNPKLLVAEWVSKVKCLWCFKETRQTRMGPVSMPWDCRDCPVFGRDKEDSFDVVVNKFAGGSQTPHTNIHLGKMRSLKEFLTDEFNVVIDKDWYQTLEEEVKKWDLNKPVGRVNWTQFNNVVRDLKSKCPWLKGRHPNNIPAGQGRLDSY
jgi:hypothetical protein